MRDCADEVRVRAMESGQFSAAVAAIKEKCVLAGAAKGRRKCPKQISGNTPSLLMPARTKMATINNRPSADKADTAFVIASLEVSIGLNDLSKNLT